MSKGWPWRAFFFMAVAAAAAGLGSCWRFPYQAYVHGGTFLIPFVAALLTAGVPLIVVECGLGRGLKQPAPAALHDVHPRMEWLGWCSSLSAVAVVSYGVIILGWLGRYMVEAFMSGWGEAPVLFFIENLSAAGGLSVKTVAYFLAAWLLVTLKALRNERGGKLQTAAAPLTVLLLLILVIRAVTLPGAGKGLYYFFVPDWPALLHPEVWLAAYGQVFFALGLGTSALIAYAAALPEKEDITGKALLWVLAEGGAAVLAGVISFAAAGFLAAQSGAAPAAAVPEPAGLFPAAVTVLLNRLPLPSLLGVPFFFLLAVNVLDFLSRLLKGVAAAVVKKWHVRCPLAVLLAAAPPLAAGLLYLHGGGIAWIKLLDAGVAQYALVLIVAVQSAAAGWFYPAGAMREQVNLSSSRRLGEWWDLWIKYYLPVLLFFLVAWSACLRIWPREFTIREASAWGLPVLLLAAIIVLSSLRARAAAGDQHGKHSVV